jgi:serine/threonine protein kinase
MENLVGKSFGRYHITDRLGEGGMASVYKAFDTNLERYVAIKVIRRDREDDSFLKRFQREAKALAHLDHPYILKVLDYGEEEGMPYLVMPLVAGGTLKESLKQAMPYQEAAALLAPVARALEYAHSQGIIHRDVKPANILISQSGAPVLSDFGVAKILEKMETTQLTGTGVGIGTPDYMAPEQWLGQADKRTDIYALGVVFFQMVTGKLPYSADTPAAVLLKHMNDPLPQPKTYVPDLPDAVDSVIYKALAKDPTERFQDMGAFASSLEKLSRDEITQIPKFDYAQATRVAKAPATLISSQAQPQTQAHPQTQGVYSPQAAPKKSKAWLWVGAAVVGGGLLILVCILAGGMLWFSKKDATPTPTTEVVAEVQRPTHTPVSQKATLAPTESASTPSSTDSVLPPIFSTSAESTPIQTIEGLPEDVPILADNNGDLSTTTSQGMYLYNFSTNMPIDEVRTFYEDAMSANGWELMATTTQDTTISLTYAKADYTRMVMVNLVDQTDSVYISLMVVTE